MPLRGVRPGVTLPLSAGGVVVGTVGITGAPDRVRRFGRVVRRQIEILLQESAHQHSRLLRERALEDLVGDIASYDPELIDPELIEGRVRDLGYTLRLRRRLVVIEVGEPARRRQGWTPRTETLRPELLRVTRAAFPGHQDIVTSLTAGKVVVAHLHPEGAPERSVELARRAVAELTESLGVAARAGVGTSAREVAGLRDSYGDAVDALRLGGRATPGTPVCDIDALRVYQAVATMGHQSRRRLLYSVAGPLVEHRDWLVYRETLLHWCDNGFNLVRAAASLGVHRNTLVHRLERIEQVAGRAPREFAMALYLCCVADVVTSGTET